MCSSVVERCPDKTEVEGPIPSTLTVKKEIITIVLVSILLVVQICFFIFSDHKKISIPSNLKNLVSQPAKIQ